jgi:hypothetical protein
MLDELISIYNHTNYDFRNYAFPGDKFSHLFDEWVDYYRMKYAIAKMIHPTSILEIGVRYGYSAITFLKASENATYLGIENNSNTFGENKETGNWAKKITENYKAEFLLANSQSMTTLPGDFYDLIHIDGKQDGGFRHHLHDVAIRCGGQQLDHVFYLSEAVRLCDKRGLTTDKAKPGVLAEVRKFLC